MKTAAEAGAATAAIVQLSDSAAPDDGLDALQRARAFAEPLLAAEDGAPEARAALERSLARLRELYPVETPAHADAHVALARIDLREGQPDDALVHADAAAAVWRQLSPESRWLGEALSLRARALDATAHTGDRSRRLP